MFCVSGDRIPEIIDEITLDVGQHETKVSEHQSEVPRPWAAVTVAEVENSVNFSGGIRQHITFV